MVAEKELLLKAYDTYNQRDVEALTALVSSHVDWPNNDARLHGRDEVRVYWLEQWARIHTHDEPLEIRRLADGRSVVRIHQVVRTLDGSKLSEGTFEHIYKIENGTIMRMDIQPVHGPE